MAVNMQKILSEYNSGVSIKALAAKYKMSEKQLNEAIQKELAYSTSSQNYEYQQQLAEHNKKVNNEFNIAYEKLKSGYYMEALKSGLSATIGMFNPPQNPNIITGTAPCPMKWADVKSLFSLIKSLKNLPQIIKNLKNCKGIQQFKNFMTKLAQKLKFVKSNIKNASKVSKSTKPKTHAQLVQKCSNGKNIIDMTDEELVVYYKKLIPDINREELKCLIDQVHRIKKGEPRWLNTEEEERILARIQSKLRSYEHKKGISSYERQPNGTYKSFKYDETVNKPADIPFKHRELTQFQKNQLSGWYNKGQDAYLNPIFDELGTVLDHDVYLYRCVTVRGDAYLTPGLEEAQAKFLNTIKEGAVINNNKYTSTASNINNTLDLGDCFGKQYILKIKVPKGTKVMDMRHNKPTATEIVLPPCSYKVNKIDYTTGIVDCDFIPH